MSEGGETHVLQDAPSSQLQNGPSRSNLVLTGLDVLSVAREVTVSMLVSCQAREFSLLLPT